MKRPQIRMTNVTASGNKGHGIFIQGDFDAQISDTNVSGNGGSGIFVEGGGDLSLHNIVANGNKETAIYLRAQKLATELPELGSATIQELRDAALDIEKKSKAVEKVVAFKQRLGKYFATSSPTDYLTAALLVAQIFGTLPK